MWGINYRESIYYFSIIDYGEIEKPIRRGQEMMVTWTSGIMVDNIYTHIFWSEDSFFSTF